MPIEFVATSRLPTAFGEFNITVFQDPETGEEHVALSKGLEQAPTEPVFSSYSTPNASPVMPSLHSNVTVAHNFKPPKN